MILMSLDPGLRAGGYFIYDEENKKVLDVGHFKHPDKLSQERRLFLLHKLVDEKIVEWKVEKLVIEKMFVDVLSRAVGASESGAGKHFVTSEKMPPAHWMK